MKNKWPSASPEYSSWENMCSRCVNPNANTYSYYGGRGITVCERWRYFRNFIADMGPKPSPKHTLDRINPDGNYEPGNCRWATRSEQSFNRRKQKFCKRGHPLSNAYVYRHVRICRKCRQIAKAKYNKEHGAL